MAALNRPYVGLTEQELQARLKDPELTGAEKAIVLDEIEQRKINESIHKAAKLHWIVWATFIATLLGLAVSTIGYWPQLKAFFQSPKSYFHDPSGQPHQ